MPGTLKSYETALSWSPKNLRTAALSIFSLRKTLFQGLLWKIQGLFKDMPKFVNFQGLFKDMILFQGPFRTRASHAFLFYHSLLNTIII